MREKIKRGEKSEREEGDKNEKETVVKRQGVTEKRKKQHERKDNKR